MAEIYRAVLSTTDGPREIAIKRLLPRYNDDEAFIIMLTDEARITGALDHPNIARVFEFGVVDEQYFLALEFIDGQDLRAMLRRTRERCEPVDPKVGCWIVQAALRGLHCAHTQADAQGDLLKIVHRDFSPSNILVGYDGAVKLIDFGIAKARLNRSRTRGGFIKGKVKYMSPEQTEGRRLDGRSDVFAAGIVLYQALTGHLPFHAPSDAELMVAIREQQPDPPSHESIRIHPGLDGVLARALAKSPEDRFSSAEAFADALSRFTVGVTAAGVGAHLRRIFGQERQEAAALYGAAELTGLHAQETPTDQRVHYTKLVDVGAFTASAAGPRDQVDSWLADLREQTRCGPATPTTQACGDGTTQARVDSEAVTRSRRDSGELQ